MSLPSNFDDWEHFQSTLMQLHNRRIKREFSDLGDDWEPNISTPRAGLRQACTIKDSDNALICLSKQLFFWFELGFVADLVEPIYGMPIEEVQSYARFKYPQITLHFREDDEDIETGYRPLRMRLSFRLTNENPLTITKAKLTVIANKIDSKFCTNNGYKIHKGKILVTYKDLIKGYDLQLYVYSKNDAKGVITDLLFCNGDVPDWKFLKVHEDEEPMTNYPTVPEKQQILSELVRQPRKRAVGWVRFQFAECKIPGREKDVILVDRVWKFKEVLVRAS